MRDKKKFYQTVTGRLASRERTLGDGAQDKARQKNMLRVKGKKLLRAKRQDKEMVHVLRTPRAGACRRG